MRIRHLLALLAAALLARPAAAQERVLVRPEPGTPVVATEVLIAVGPADEAEGKEGITYLTARSVTAPILPVLDSLAAHLEVEQQKVVVDEREALRSRYRAKLDGVPVELLFLVLKACDGRRTSADVASAPVRLAKSSIAAWRTRPRGPACSRTWSRYCLSTFRVIRRSPTCTKARLLCCPGFARRWTRCSPRTPQNAKRR